MISTFTSSGSRKMEIEIKWGIRIEKYVGIINHDVCHSLTKIDIWYYIFMNVLVKSDRGKIKEKKKLFFFILRWRSGPLL